MHQEASQKQEEAHLARTVIMIRPFSFRSNEMTISSNHYQQISQAAQQCTITQKALKQFDSLAALLIKNGVNVLVTQDTGKNDTPDSVFPNNWVSFHSNRKYILYPMFAPNRRLQRDIDIFSALPHTTLLHDYSSKEREGIFLEGTGSMVLDRKLGVAFAAISPRTDQQLFKQFCQQNGFIACAFRAYQTVNGKREAIYHTNVMMWIGEGVAAVCLACIDDPAQRQSVYSHLAASQREVILLTEEQISDFAGNCLMLQANEGKLIAMSDQAYNAYTPEQRALLAKHASLLHSDISTIENYGGGSVRCMLAEFY